MWKLIWKLSKPNLLETYPSNIFAFPEQFEKKKKNEQQNSAFFKVSRY